MSSRSLGYRAPLLWLVLPFIAGLAVGKIGDFTPASWLLGGALLSALIAVWSSWRAPRWWAPALVVAMALTGMANYALARARLPGWEKLPAREARFSLRIDRVFSQKNPLRLSGLATVDHSEGHLKDLVGQRVYFAVTLKRGAAVPVRSAVVSAIGVLETLPRDPPADSFDGFLAGGGVNFRLKRGQFLAEEKPAALYYRFCARALDRFNEILGLGIAEKLPRLAGLLRAMMLGATSDLTEEQHELFMNSGTMHLFAISGMNIGVVAGVLQWLLIRLRLSAWPRFVVASALLWLFVDITGTSPSAVRAFVMAVFFQAAFVLRKPANPVSALVGSAFFILLLAPLQLFSASFLMSYAIVAALLLLGLPLGDAWLERWQPWRHLPPITWSWWQKMVARMWHASAVTVAIGLATTLVGLLTGLQYFRLLTPGSLLANLLLIPAASLATLAGFASLLFGLVGLNFAAIACNYLAAGLLWVIEWIVRLSVRIPKAFIHAEYLSPWVSSLALAILLTLMIAGYASGWKRKFVGWWTPFAFVALVLLFGVKFT